MPSYRYKCENGHVNMIRSSVENRDEPKPCHGGRENEECDEMAERDMMEEMSTKAAHVFEADFFPELADDENPDGKYITSRDEFKKEKKKLGLRERDSYIE